MTVQSKPTMAFVYVLLVLFLFCALFPVIWAVLLSVSPEAEIFSEEMHIVPRSFTLDHFRAIFTDIKDFPLYFRNSCIFVSVSLGLILLVASMSGFALRQDIPGTAFIFVCFMVILAIPRTLFLVPLYQMVSVSGLYNTWASIIIPSVAFAVPFSTFVMRTAFRSIPRELEEAAIIDGANTWQMFVRVMLPLAKPGMIIIGVFNFLALWNEFILILIMTQSTSIQTLPVGMLALRGELGAGARSMGMLAAGIVISIMPTVALYLALQRYFVKGIASGALKG